MTGRVRITNLDQFTRELKRFGEETMPNEFVAAQKKIALEMFRRIVMKTPVGNPSLWSTPPPPGYVGGRARGNWQMQFQRTNENETGNIDPSGTKTLANGVSSLAAVKPYGIIWIFNNAPYIRALEDGWSRQAPSGMVALTVAEFARRRI